MGWKKKIKNPWWWVKSALIWIPLGALTISPLALCSYLLHKYVEIFDGPFSNDQDTWGQFGDLVGGLLNPSLSFYALIAALSALAYQMRESKKARENALYQIFESTFFKLLEIHTKKLELIRYGSDEGPGAFSSMVSNFNAIVSRNVTQKYLMEVPSSFDELIDEWIQTMTTEFMANYAFECQRLIKSQPDRKKYDVVKEVLDQYGKPPAETIFANVNEVKKRRIINQYAETLSENELELIFLLSSDELYQGSGNAYGHYFRNMSMMLDHLDSIAERIAFKFSKLFRAQLSRSEIAMLLINCVSSRTSVKFNSQVEKYDLFNGIELDDLRFGKSLSKCFKNFHPCRK